MGPKNGIKKRPSAKTRVRKIDKELLNSQFSQSQTLSQTQSSVSGGPRTPRRRKKPNNSLVKPHQTIFSPKKRLDESDDEFTEYSSDSENENKIGEDDVDEENAHNSSLYSSSDETELKESASSGSTRPDLKSVRKPLTTYTIPLNTKKWQPLPQPIHSELSTLLQLLSPPSLDEIKGTYREKMDKDVILPLSDKFSTIYLPPVHKYLPKKVQRQRGSGDFNLNMLHQDQKRLISSYDINSKQLDTLVLQLLKEKEMVATERKYLRQLKEKTNRWKQNKEKRLQRLKSLLGDSFREVSNSIDLRNSGLDGADDLDMIGDSSDGSNYDSLEGDAHSSIHDTEDAEITSLLHKLSDRIKDCEAAGDSGEKLEMSLKHLLNQLES